jgi:hypothetical protein
MSHAPSLRRRLLLALAGAALLLGAMSAAAHAEPYGELGHFGKGAGTGPGQFQIPSEKVETHAFGVDPTDNSVYVGDEPTEGEYRIQKLSATGQFLASVSFKPSHPIGLEGIAVDPAKERVYVLAVALRSATSIDPAKRAAETLYAFKTNQSGEILESAVSGVSAEAKEGVLANSTTLETESEVQGHALLEPSGIAVDPTTHDVIVMGHEDQEANPEESQLRVALQRVSENGVLGPRYVDKTNCFGGEGSTECKDSGAKQPNSPVVSPTGRVYVESFDQIWEIPSDFTSAQPPKVFIPFGSSGEEGTVGGSVQELVEFPGAPSPAAGGGLSLVAEDAGEGTIYAYSNITQEKEGTLGFKYPGALAFRYVEHGADPTEITELGWTGGQSKASGGGKCTVSFLETPSVAAGKEHDLFVLNPKAPNVVEFGPGGTGCPTASATTPTLTVKGQAVTEVPAGTKVTLSSTVEQANALSVEWSFGDGDTESVSTDEFRTTKVTHEYKLGGEHTITETIHTDDLQTPEIVVKGKLKVTGGSTTEAVKITSQPVAQEVTEGETATFTAAAAGAPSPTVQWQLSTNGGGTWRDVSGATSDTLKVEHTTMSESGYEYQAVFTNEVSKTTTTAATLTVKALKEAPVVTENPADKAVLVGEDAVFEAAASGLPAPTVQWQLSTDGGGTWSDVPDATADTLTVSGATTAENDYEYRAVFTNEVSNATSAAATLTVSIQSKAPQVTENPVDKAVLVGEDAVFEAAASGVPTPTVQWQVSTNGGGAWGDLPGATSDTLDVEHTTVSESGYEYRAVFTNEVSEATSTAATLTVSIPKEAPEVTENPVDKGVVAGGNAVFEATASGLPAPTVQWQLSTDGGGTWSDVSGATADTLTVSDALISESGYEYRAVFTNEVSIAATTVATLTVKEKEPEATKHKEEKSGEPIVSPTGSKEPMGWPEEPLVSPLPAGSSPASGGGVLGGHSQGPSPAPDAELASTTLTTNTTGAVSLAVSCPAGESSCAGTVTLRTLGAVSARKKKGKATVLTLASGSFTVAGGATQPITLRLSGQARALLSRLHVLRVIATIVAHDATGATHTTRATVTLRAPKSKHGKG